jgi:hypothetical protein
VLAKLAADASGAAGSGTMGSTSGEASPGPGF